MRALLAGYLLVFASAWAQEAKGPVVRLVPLQSFPAGLMDAVEAKLEEEVGVTVTRQDAIPLPKEAWYEPRKRWRADRILEVLPVRVGLVTGERALALTTVDISVTKGQYPDWGVFGYGEMPGDAAVISTFRLHKGVDEAGLTRRVGIIAVHEVGHTFGLPHCTEAGCVMLDAEGGTTNIDTGTGHFGPKCREKLTAAMAGR